MRTQAEKAAMFRALHERPGAFIIPNPWDAGTGAAARRARLRGARHHEPGARQHARPQHREPRRDPGELPADRGGDQPAGQRGPGKLRRRRTRGRGRDASASRRQAGAVGGSIEDATGDPRKPIYDFALAVERVQAAVEVARSLPIPFMLTARAENFVAGRADLDDTIRRLQAFEAAGADVLYAPGLKDLATIRTVVSSVNKPVNVVMTHADPTLTAARTVGRRREAHQHRRQPVAIRARRLPQGRARDEGARGVQLHPRSGAKQGASGRRSRRDSEGPATAASNQVS